MGHVIQHSHGIGLGKTSSAFVISDFSVQILNKVESHAAQEAMVEFTTTMSSHLTRTLGALINGRIGTR
jgi:protein-arginine kinase